MKYELEKAVVVEVFKIKSECPFCLLRQSAEERSIRYFTGNSVMAHETRLKVNKSGFCREHWLMIYQKAEALFTAFLTHTHLKEFQKNWNSSYEEMEKELTRQEKKKSLLPAKEFKKLARKINSDFDKVRASCLVCNQLQEHLMHYYYTAVILWKKDPSFQGLFQNSRGFCLEHFQGLLAMADEILLGQNFVDFFQLLIKLQDKSFSRLEREIWWFTQKFDQKNASKPWGSSKDALPRILNKICGPIKSKDK